MSDRHPGRKYAIGCDVGATKISLTVAFEPGAIKDRIVDSTDRMKGPAALVKEVTAMVEEITGRNELSRADCLGVGVAFAGPVNRKKGTVIYGTNIPGWANVPLGHLLEEKLAVPVIVQNDANAGALGEYRHGEVAGEGDMLYITVSTGIGGGLIVNGEPYDGSNSIAGEIGHTTVIKYGPRCACGKHGCLESVASGLSIEKLAEELRHTSDTSLNNRAEGHNGRVSAAIVFEEARKGDMLASELVDNACRYLGLAIANAVMLMSFSSVVLGGGVAKEGEYLRKRVEHYARRELASGPNETVRVLVSKMPESVVDIGALEVIFDRSKIKGVPPN